MSSLPKLLGLGCLAIIVIVLLEGSLLDPTPDFADFPAGEDRKQAFIGYFAPLIREVNSHIEKERQSVLAMRTEADNLSAAQKRTLSRLAEHYGLRDFDPQDPDWNALLARIDTIPVSLALAQGANESAWGTSRFARDGHNFFGQWCYTPGCGLVPKNRPAGQTHEVASFSDAEASVASYIANLNRNPAYRELRVLREQLEQNQNPITGLTLADGLVSYSERGQAYVSDIKAMIRTNNLQRFDTN